MNLSRLMVLGILAAHGPMHGHQIRRHAEVTNVEAWGGVSVGSLYRELHRMEGEGLVEPVRSEQVGRRPERTVYAIGREGWRELNFLREQAATELRYGPDPLGVALLFGGFADDPARLAELLGQRRQAIANSLEALVTERERLVAKGYIDETCVAVFRRGEVHVAAELAWHDEWAERLAATHRNDTTPDDLSGAGQQPGVEKNGVIEMRPGSRSAEGGTL